MHSAAAHREGKFNESELEKWARDLRSRVEAPSISLGLVFLSPGYFEHARQVLEIIRVHAQVALLAGCSSQGHIQGSQELEDKEGVTLAIYHLPGARLKGFHFGQSQVEEANGPGYWRLETGVEPDDANGWLAFLDPFQTDTELWLKTWNEAYAPLPVFGGLASGGEQQRTQVYLDGEVFEEGGVVVSVGGEVKLAGITSQGCTPIGETWTITKVEQNVIHKIGNRRAYDVLAETFSALSPQEQNEARGNLFIGLVVNEYLEDFHRGDFLVRNLLAADANSGAIAVGALPRQGQTIQFQRRSAAAADEDLKALLSRKREELGASEVLGGCLCSCNGRGKSLFGAPDHDASMVQQLLGPIGLAGFFCNGEIGPVGEKNFVHGYTASLALFVR